MDVVKLSRHGYTPDFHPHHWTKYSIKLLQSRCFFSIAISSVVTHVATISPPVLFGSNKVRLHCHYILSATQTNWSSCKIFICIQVHMCIISICIFELMLKSKCFIEWDILFLPACIKMLLKKKYFVLVKMLCLWLRSAKLSRVTYTWFPLVISSRFHVMEITL